MGEHPALSEDEIALIHAQRGLVVVAERYAADEENAR